MAQTTGLLRKTTDKYYTKNQVADLCIEQTKKKIDIDYTNDIFIEPSAGNGSFIKGIKSLSKNYMFYDIEPENDEIVQKDFLMFDYKPLIDKYRKIHIIGNPPFGRQCSMGIKFIKKSAEFCDTIAFILPRSFKKDSMKRFFPLNFHLIDELDLQPDSFLVAEKNHQVPCVFQIWVKKKEKRSIPEKLSPIKFTFVKKTENHDISIRRVGVYSGNIDRNTSSKSPQSHYFIKFQQGLTEKLYDQISKIEYKTKDYTVGSRSISKQEIIQEINKVIIRFPDN